MAGLLIFLAACLMVNAAPPSQPRLNYYEYLDRQEGSYYQTQQKLANNPSQNGAPARLENLDPNSEVEIIPGSQQPQYPREQNPIDPYIPGLIPGQRVFIVHMPIPGNSPGTVGGYQPKYYILTAAPQWNMGYPGSDPAQAGGVLGYFPPGLGLQGPPLFGGALLNRPYDLGYQNALAYQPNLTRQIIHTPVSQGPAEAKPINDVDPEGSLENEPKNGQVRIETKDSAEEDRGNIRPTHQIRNKA